MLSNINKINIKKVIIILIIAILAFWTFKNYDTISNIINTIYNVFEPFILGGVIAFILNIPASKIETFIKKHTKNKNHAFARIISIILSLLFLIAIILFTLLLLIPELIENIDLLINNIPKLITSLENSLPEYLNKYPDLKIQLETIFKEKINLEVIIPNILNYIANGIINFIGNLFSGFITIFTSIIFSIYILSQKEHLLRVSKKLIYAFTNKKQANKILENASLIDVTFNKFISGQCLEAVILGVIIFIVSIICNFPYALIIAVLTTVTALIPYFGALIAMIIGAILIGITNPIKALIFIIVFLIVQQIEGNFIYPKVVGASVGLSPIWTLLAITIGGNLFGIVGMIISIPLASVAYTILKNNVNHKLKEKNIKVT